MCHPHTSIKAWGGAVLRAFCSKYSMYKLATMGLTREPITTPLTCSWNWSWNEKYMFLRQNSNIRIMSLTVSTILSMRVGTFFSRSLKIPRAGSTGTGVNRADTS